MSDAVAAIQRELDKARLRIKELEGGGNLSGEIDSLNRKIQDLEKENHVLKAQIHETPKVSDTDVKALKRELDKEKRRADSAAAERDKLKSIAHASKEKMQFMHRAEVEANKKIKELENQLQEGPEIAQEIDNLSRKVKEAEAARDQALRDTQDVVSKLKETIDALKARMDPPKNLEEYIARYEKDAPPPTCRIRKSRRLSL